MSNRWLARIMLGLPFDERDLDDLIDAAPELLQDNHLTHSLLPLRLLHHLMDLHDSYNYKDLQDRWFTALQAARKRARDCQEQVEPIPHVATSDQECPHPDCPLLKKNSQPRVLNSESHFPKGVEPEGVVLYQMVVMAHGNAPQKHFLNMTRQLRGRINNGVKRVIVTDPYVHCDKAEDGTPGGHTTLLSFLEALGLTKDTPFTLELTPAPKGGTDGQPLEQTPLGSTLRNHFPNVDIKHHNPCRGGFHDRFYLTVDGSGRWDGLYGPSLNGLASRAIVLLGELEKDSLAKKNLKKLLD